MKCRVQPNELRSKSKLTEKNLRDLFENVYGDTMSHKLPTAGYERHLLRRAKEIKAKIEENKKLLAKIREVPKGDARLELKKAVLEQIISANLDHLEQELQRIKQELNNLYYRTGIYLGRMGKKLDRLAKYLNKSKSEIVREALEEYFQKYGW